MRSSGDLRSAAAQRRIAALAADRTVHRAFSWLHLHQPQIRQWLLDLVRIPAPTFGEAARASWFEQRFHELSLQQVCRDDAGNVLGLIAPANTWHANAPVLLISAHLDTVFPADTRCEPRLVTNTSRIEAPGVADNGAGLSALLALAASFQHAGITPPVPLLFAANVGEEGEGNLYGMRHLFEKGAYARRIAAAIALEGAGTATVVDRALGSKRLSIQVTTPGGHSWTDANNANAIVLLSRAITALAQLELPDEPRTTLNVGKIEGGISVNSIAAEAVALLDIRSTDRDQLATTSAQVEQTLHSIISQGGSTAVLRIASIGDRPAAALAKGSELLQTIHAVDRHLGLRTEARLGSTDANLPLSLGIPAVAMAAGGNAGGMHTIGEWFDGRGREIALRRLVLTILDTAHVLATGNGFTDRGSE